MKIVQVDAFTDKPFCGNPAAVCITEKALDDDLMQSIAAEMNLSETAFLYPIDKGYSLRWFTPRFEVKLCGHATLASAKVLWSDRHSKAELLEFQTLSGELRARRDGDMIELDFPIRPPVECEEPKGLCEALGVSPGFIGFCEEDFLLELDSEEAVRSAKPDFGKLEKVSARGVIITSRSSGKYDCVSRFFAPSFGINEDPVTGSAHCAIGAYWSKKLGKDQLKAFQASSRGGEMELKVTDKRVFLKGSAVIVLRAELVLN